MTFTDHVILGAAGIPVILIGLALMAQAAFTKARKWTEADLDAALCKPLPARIWASMGRSTAERAGVAATGVVIGLLIAASLTGTAILI